MDTPRFVLSAQELSECFAAAGCLPAESHFFAGLPVARGQLPARLSAGDGKLDPALRFILETAAQPAFSLLFRAARASAARTLILGGNEAAYVAFAHSEQDRWDIALIEEREAMLGLVDRLTGKPEQVSGLSTAMDGTAKHGGDAGFCGRCGMLYEDSPAFCRECGAPLEA